jgi:hypothetical protein
MGRMAVPLKNGGRQERERQQTHTLQDEREKLSLDETSLEMKESFEYVECCPKKAE